MEPRETSPRQAPATDRPNDVVAEPGDATDHDIIRPSSMIRVTWRLTADKQASTDSSR